MLLGVLETHFDGHLKIAVNINSSSIIFIFLLKKQEWDKILKLEKYFFEDGLITC